MKIGFIPLNPRLSKFSLTFIQTLILTGIFFLPFSKSIGEICFSLAFVLWFLRKMPWDEELRGPALFVWAYGLFLITALVSFINIPEEHLTAGLRGLLKSMKFFGVFFLCAEIFRDPKLQKRFLYTVIASAVLVCLNGFYQMFTGMDLVKHYSIDIPGRLIRMKSSFGSPNDLSTFLILALPLIFIQWVEKERWSAKSALYALILILCGTAFILTLSRSAFVAVITALVLYAVLNRKKWVLAAALVIPLILFFSGPLSYNFFKSLNLKDITILERFRFWGITWDMIQAHPWAGNGINMYYLKFGSFAPAAEAYRGYAHNCFLQMWSEVGTFGVFLFFVPLGLVLLRSFFEKNTGPDKSYFKDALWIGLTAFIIQSFFDTHFYALQTAYYFWIFWGLFIAMKETAAHSRRF